MTDSESTNTDPNHVDALELHIVSGGVGASAELLAHTVLVQFPGAEVPLVIHPHVHDMQEVQEIVASVASTSGLILHTLVRTHIRDGLSAEAQRQGVVAIDVAGPLMEQLSERLQMKPVGQPGRYRKLYDQYFKRVDAIEFTIAHDDGKRSADLDQADIVLMGVSRLGKTPLSIYLAMQGWRVANVPFVPGLVLPVSLRDVDRRRVIGLSIEPPQLAVHRRWRERRLGVEAGNYVDQKRIAGELREAKRFFVSHDIPVIDVTDKPIETSGTEIIAVITRRLNSMPAGKLTGAVQ